MDTIYNKVTDNLSKKKIINKSILIGYSGGKDSSVLLDLLIKLSKELNLKLFAAYINHNLRKDSDKEEKFIINKIKNLNIKLFKLKINKKTWQKIKQESVEMAARRIRYDFFNKVCLKNKIDYIVTAHNLNDKIETFFINLFRSSGIDTLKSIQIKNKKIIRPLINITRDEIDKYILNNKISFYEDYTNKENNFKRNIIRNELLPVIKKIHPDYVKSFLHIFDFFNEEYNYVNKNTLFFLKKNLIFKSDNLYIIDLVKYKKTNIVIQKNLIKIILKKMKLIKYINLKMLNQIADKNKKIKYENKNFLITGNNRFLFIINKDNIKINFKTFYIKKIPDKIKNNLSFKISNNINSDFKSRFSFNYKKSDFPLKIKLLNKNDEITIDDNKYKKIINILKNNKIPQILYKNTIVIQNKSKKIIGFILYNMQRVSKEFYINDINKTNAVIKVNYSS